MGNPGNVAVESQVTVVVDTLEVVMKCARLFKDADEEMRISFDDQIIPTSFEIIGKIYTKASRLSADERERYLAHIRDNGSDVCLEIIAQAQRRSPPVIHRRELVEKLITEKEGY